MLPPGKLLSVAVPALLAAPALASTVQGAPLIPEPMVFDMVRPLAAPRGELEANTLALFPLDAPGEAIDWAPEIEYAFADGHAIELEFPFANGRLTGFKLGLQGTFGTLLENTLLEKRVVHGWQYLGVLDRDDGRLASSLLYLLGARWGGPWSSMTMIGLDRPATPRDRTLPRDNALLINHAVFRELGEHRVIGIETNVRTSSRQTSLLVMPQLHERLSGHLMLQLGAGVQKPPRKPVHPTLAMRLVREF